MENLEEVSFVRLKNPFTKTGEVKYFELFKLVVFVMVFIMSISYFTNSIELANAYIVESIFTFYMLFIYIGLFVSVLFDTISVLKLYSASIIKFIHKLLEIRISLDFDKCSISSEFVQDKYNKMNQIRLCVMRC